MRIFGGGLTSDCRRLDHADVPELHSPTISVSVTLFFELPFSSAHDSV
jgi:hypothetical protein